MKTTSFTSDNDELPDKDHVRSFVYNLTKEYFTVFMSFT